MPHLILQFSSNITEKNNFSDLFQNFHRVLTEMLPTQLASCKSRAIECDKYYVGDGQAKNAFIHLEVKILPGRSYEKIKEVGDEIMDLLQDHFATSLKKLHVQMTLEITEAQKTYFKVIS